MASSICIDWFLKKNWSLLFKLKNIFLYPTKSNLLYVLSVIIFKLILEFTYWTVINPYYQYMGFYFDPTFSKYIESWILYLCLVYFCPKRLTKPSDLFLLILFLNIITPILSFYALANKSRYFLYISLFCFVLVSLFRNGRPIRLKTLKEGRAIVIFICITFAFGMSIILLYNVGLESFNLDLSKVGHFRELNYDIIAVGLIGYLSTWCFNVIGPTLLVFFLWKKAYFCSFGILMVQTLWFGLTGYKFVLFSPLLILFVWFFFRNNSSFNYILLGLIILIITCLVFFFVFDLIRPVSTLVRRVFFVPAKLSFAYYEFFNLNEIILWANSKISFGLIAYPYAISPAKLIGEYTGTGAHANNSFISTGYMHAGIIGVIVYGVIVGLLYRFIDSISLNGLPLWCSIGIIIVPVYSLTISSDLPVAILTKGLGFAVILLFLIRKIR